MNKWDLQNTQELLTVRFNRKIAILTGTAKDKLLPVLITSDFMITVILSPSMAQRPIATLATQTFAPTPS
jgi:hypothetical protein